jgi:zinc transporter ZupT
MDRSAFFLIIRDPKLSFLGQTKISPTSATFSAVILLAFLSGLTILIGVALAFYFKRSVKGIVIGIGFSAGIMMLISFFELIPESFG